MIRITFEKEQTTKNISFHGTIQDLLAHLQINPETVIVAQNNAIVEKNATIEDNSEILIISVISGG